VDVRGNSSVVVESESSSESMAESPSWSTSCIEPLLESDVKAASDSASDCERKSKTLACHQSGLLTSESVISTGFVILSSA